MINYVKPLIKYSGHRKFNKKACMKSIYPHNIVRVECIILESIPVQGPTNQSQCPFTQVVKSSDNKI